MRCLLFSFLGLLAAAVPSSGDILITEFMASNQDALVDQDGDSSDWLENPNLDAVRAATEFGDQATSFNLTVNVQLPDAEGNGG